VAKITNFFEYDGAGFTSTIVPIITPYHNEFKNWIILFFGLNILISFGWEYIKIIRGESQFFPSGKILSQVVLLGLNIIYFHIIFSAILYFSNNIADKIYPVEKMAAWSNAYLGTTVPEISVFHLQLAQLIASTLKICATIAFYGIGLWRYILLTLFFLFSPIMCCLSINPLYSGNLYKSYVKEIIQVASWPIILAGFMLALDNVVFAIAGTSSAFSFTVEFIVIISVFLWGLLKIPFIASTIFSGTDFSSLTVGTGMMSAAIKFVPPLLTKHAPKAVGGIAKWAGGKALSTLKGNPPPKPNKPIEKGA
jgi:hypothetical protein